MLAPIKSRDPTTKAELSLSSRFCLRRWAVTALAPRCAELIVLHSSLNCSGVRVPVSRSLPHCPFTNAVHLKEKKCLSSSSLSSPVRWPGCGRGGRGARVTSEMNWTLRKKRPTVSSPLLSSPTHHFHPPLSRLTLLTHPLDSPTHLDHLIRPQCLSGPK